MHTFDRNVRSGFAARCAAVASPRRSASTLARAVPLVRALPSRLFTLRKKRVTFTSFYHLTKRKQPYASPFSDIPRLTGPLHHSRYQQPATFFKTDQMKSVLCRALDEARKSAGFLLFAYVIMISRMSRCWLIRT